MIDQLVVDTNAVVEYIRLEPEYPRQLDEAKEVFFPLTVISEQFYAASRSDHPEHSGATDDDCGRVAVRPVDLIRHQIAAGYRKLRLP